MIYPEFAKSLSAKNEFTGF